MLDGSFILVTSASSVVPASSIRPYLGKSDLKLSQPPAFALDFLTGVVSQTEDLIGQT